MRERYGWCLDSHVCVLVLHYVFLSGVFVHYVFVFRGALYFTRLGTCLLKAHVWSGENRKTLPDARVVDRFIDRPAYCCCIMFFFPVFLCIMYFHFVERYILPGLVHVTWKHTCDQGKTEKLCLYIRVWLSVHVFLSKGMNFSRAHDPSCTYFWCKFILSKDACFCRGVWLLNSLVCFGIRVIG